MYVGIITYVDRAQQRACWQNFGNLPPDNARAGERRERARERERERAREREREGESEREGEGGEGGREKARVCARTAGGEFSDGNRGSTGRNLVGGILQV